MPLHSAFPFTLSVVTKLNRSPTTSSAFTWNYLTLWNTFASPSWRKPIKYSTKSPQYSTPQQRMSFVSNITRRILTLTGLRENKQRRDLKIRMVWKGRIYSLSKLNTDTEWRTSWPTKLEASDTSTCKLCGDKYTATARYTTCKQHYVLIMYIHKDPLPTMPLTVLFWDRTFSTIKWL